MSSVSDPVVDRGFAAALTLFARHGYQRTSMADVAVEAGMSRATLYARFRDKAALFEGLAASVVDRALVAMQAAWRPAASLAENLESTILAKDLPLHRLLHGSPHGAGLLAVDATLTQAHAARLDASFAALLRDRAVALEALGFDLGAFDGPAGFAQFVVTASAGIKHEVKAEDAYVDAIRRLCRVAARAATALPSSSAACRPPGRTDRAG